MHISIKCITENKSHFLGGMGPLFGTFQIIGPYFFSAWEREISGKVYSFHSWNVFLNDIPSILLIASCKMFICIFH